MARMARWMAWVEGQLRAVVVGEGLHVAVLGATQGPHTVTFRLRLVRPDRASLQKLLALGPVFAQALAVAPVRVVDSAWGILVEVPSPQPLTPPAPALAALTTGLAVVVGLDQWRRPVTVALPDHPVVLWVGPSGKGKSSSMKATVFALAARNGASRFRFVICAQKRADWAAFAAVAGCLALITDPAEAEAALTWAAGELLPRRTQAGAATPALLLVVDDLVNWLAKAPGLVGPLEELASQGRAAGLFLFLGTQQAGSKAGVGSSVIEDNCTARVVFRAASATAGARAAGAGRLGLEQLSGAKGDALLIIDDQVARVATGCVDDATIAQLPAGAEAGRPWQRAAARAGTGENGAERPERAVPSPHAAGHGAANAGGEPERGAEPFLPGTRPPTAAERQQLRELFARLRSKEKVYKAAWGFKNGKVAAWLTESLAETIVEPVLGGADQGAPAPWRTADNSLLGEGA